MKFFLLTPIFFVMTAVSLDSCESYRILCAFPVHVRSHFMMFEALMKGLARKGHQVDVISAFPQKKHYENYTDIVALPAPLQLINNVTFDMVVNHFSTITYYIATELGCKKCNYLGHPKILKIIKNPPKDPPYDLMITQVLSANCFMSLGHHLKIPVVGLASAAFYPWQHRIIANPANLAFVPNNLVTYVAPMTFWQRLYNAVNAVYNDLYFHYLTRSLDDTIRKYIGKDARGVREAERDLALILVNSHPSLNGPKPMTPAAIEVGGLHVQDDNIEVPQDLQNWMDNSTDGFIYFSFGSMVLIETLPHEIIQVIYKSLGKIAPIRVLIKVPNPHILPPGLPKNFRTFKWAPQYKVLEHKNVKAFITHGGLMGTQEAIHFAVPLIGVPLMADQFVNINQYAKMKIAIELSITDLTEEQMDTALHEILHNPVYKNTMRKISERFRDRPMSPMNTAIWWVEYAVRHGNSVLRSPAMDLSWWQIELLDVYAFIILSGAFVVYIMIILLRLLVKKLFTTINFKVSRQKKMQ